MPAMTESIPKIAVDKHAIVIAVRIVSLITSARFGTERPRLLIFETLVIIYRRIPRLTCWSYQAWTNAIFGQIYNIGRYAASCFLLIS